MIRTLDRIDTRILEELQKDARLSNKELAGRVDLAPSSCLERVRRLRSPLVKIEVLLIMELLVLLQLYYI